MALEMKNKFVFVDGSIERPLLTDPGFPKWKRCNMLVLSWINHFVSTEISTRIIWIKEASNVWKELQNRFSQGDNTCIHHSQQEIFTLKQADLMVSSYFTKLRVLWDELCNFSPIPVCESPTGCCCHSSKTTTGYRERDVVMSFLQGLNENYVVVRQQILIMDPLPTLPRVYSMIVQQERQIGVSVAPETLIVNVVTQPTSGVGRGRGKPGTNRLCTHCNRINHTVDTCFLKHGYPPGFKHKKYVQHVALKLILLLQNLPTPLHYSISLLNRFKACYLSFLQLPLLQLSLLIWFLLITLLLVFRI